MNKIATDLSDYTPGNYYPGAGFFKRALWYLTNVLFFLNPLCTPYGLKRAILRMFGASVGKAVVIKPRVNIKYPWNLVIGEFTWIGEKVWIDSLGKVSIGSHVCISQGAMLICGNHDYTAKGFDLMVKDIVLEDGVWVGTGSIVAPAARLASHVVLVAGSMAVGELEPYGIYRGNPAVRIKERIIDP